jgi:hypothetical protein
VDGCLMPAYTSTQAGVRLAGANATLVNRVEIALIKYAATQYAGATGNVAAYIRRLATNPAGEANAVVPLLLSTVVVADTANDPTDAELTTGIAGIWTFLCGS